MLVGRDREAIWLVLLIFQKVSGDQSVYQALWPHGDNINSSNYHLSSTQRVPGSFHRVAP